MFLVIGPYVAVLNDYMRDELHYRTDTPYVFLSMDVDAAWRWGSARGGFPYVGDDLAAGLARNGRFKVFDGEGYYDLTCPFGTQDYALSHLGIAPQRRANVVQHYYESGHQIYTASAMLTELTKDVRAFMKDLLAGSASGAEGAARSAPQPPPAQ